MKITPATLSALSKGDLANAIVASTPGGIEQQEKQGQIEQSFLETLPLDGTIKPRHGQDMRPLWESLGFVFGKPADDLFVNVKFPEGWQKKPADHSMWTYIVDEKGRKRGGVFYKAAFYDRSAHCSLDRRFQVTQTYGEGDNEAAYIEDASGEVNQRIEGLCRVRPGMEREDMMACYAKMDAAKAKLTAWLKENYPDYESPIAYW